MPLDPLVLSRRRLFAVAAASFGVLALGAAACTDDDNGGEGEGEGDDDVDTGRQPADDDGGEEDDEDPVEPQTSDPSLRLPESTDPEGRTTVP